MRTYSPGLFNVIFGGVALKDFADGTFIEVEEIGDGVTSGSGADGETYRAMPSNQRFRVTVTLNQTSPSNTILSGLYAADRASNGRGAVPLLVEDVSGQTLLGAGQAWITKSPNAGWAKTADQTRAWVIDTDNISGYILGGNE